jgi:formylglycine-generating enzyme required for sulfatase activity
MLGPMHAVAVKTVAMTSPRTRSVTPLVALLACVAACASAPPRAVAPSSPPTLGGSEAAPDESAEPEDAEDDGEVEVDTAPSSPCPAGMALVTGAEHRYCIDRYEASLVETAPDGSERPFPHYLPVDGHDVRAVSVAGAFPQGYISELQAEEACAGSQKRLCSSNEWKTACAGPAHTTFPYGDARRPGVCNDTGRSSVVAVFGARAVAASTPHRPLATHHPRKPPSAKRPPKPRTPVARKARPPRKHRDTKSTRPKSVDPGVWAKLNDPALGQVDGALARTGEHRECVNAYGVFDMVGNLHEWVATDASSAHGTFQGGYYLDTAQNGDGCGYRTVAHGHDYHDYSTGFRCCADPE